MEILNRVFNTSITGSVLFFIFLLLKPLTKKHFNSSWHYKMLILILTFFIIPVDNFIKLPVNPIPNISNSETGELGISENTNTTIKEKNARNNRITEKKNPEYEVKDNLTNKDVTPIKRENQDFQDIKFNINLYKDRIQYIWIIGIVALFLLKIIPYTRFKSFILRDSTIVEENDILELFNICKDELSINNKVRLRTCNTIGSPMLIGILHPMVLLPNMDEDYKRLKMIFLHELNHYKRKDIIIKAFGLIINAIHWFNPLIYLLLREMDKYCEYSIDEKVVEEMNINDRKYYGETILSLISNSMLKKASLTTAMGSSGKQLKARLENMIYSFKTTRKKQITSLFIGILILLSGFTVACSLLPNNTAEENDSFVVYMKEDGLYYSYLNDGNGIKVHEGKEFSYPLISKAGNYIAYTKDKSLYIYDIKNKAYEKITERQNIFDNFYEWIDDEMVYSTEEPGFKIYNPLTKVKREHVDEYYYDNFKVSNKNFLYAKQSNKWSTKEGDFVSTLGIIEINLDNYNKKDNMFEMKTIIEGKQPTDVMLGYNPTISTITEDGRYVFIMEKFASGSTSADYAGIGLYDTKEKVHIDFTDIYGAGEGTYGEEDLVVLPRVNTIAINPKDSNLIGIIKGGFRERFMNKKAVLLDIHKDKSYEIINITDKGLVAMTPSFTLDGDKLLYSATKAIDPNVITDFNQAYKDWENQPHNIYEYDLKSSQVRKLTEGNEFDFMPINISKDGILICRLNNDGYGRLMRYGRLIKIIDGKEEIIADDVIMDYFSEKNIDVFLNKDSKKNKETKTIKEKSQDINKMNELYKLKGTYIGDNSKVGNIISFLDFPEELTLNGMELFTKEEPFGLQINFKADSAIQAKYVSMSSDYIWRSQSLILFSLIDNLDYIKYAIDNGDMNITISYINREVGDSLTMSTLGYKTLEITKSKKRFKEFYDIWNENNTKANQPESLVGYIVIKDNTLHFNEVEIVEWEDKERVKELGFNEYDMPNGYAIINKNKDERIFDLADEVIFTFTDVNLDFVKKPEGDRLYTTTKKDEFMKHLGVLNDFPLSEQKLPYFIEVMNGKVISITEKFKYTI